MLGLSVTQGLVRTEALDEAGALAGVRVQLLLPGPAPLVGACPGVCLLGTADTPGQRCGSTFSAVFYLCCGCFFACRL